MKYNWGKILRTLLVSEFSNLGFVDNHMMAPIRKKINVIAPIEISYDF